MKVSHIIDKINEYHLFVPAFQREYVWKRNDAKNLIDSLLNEYPTGTMLTWETTTPPELKGDYVYENSKGAVKLILDGQQRITTLYMLMTGEIPPYYTDEEIVNDIRGLFINVEDLSLEYFKKTKMENDPCWVNITDIFKGNIRTRDIVDELEQLNDNERIPRERENKIDDSIEKVKGIANSEFLEQIIPVKATIKEAIDIFYIVNSSGVNLTDAELALAQISGYWPQARELFKNKLDELKNKGWVFKLDFLVYVLLAVLHKQGSKMEKLHSIDNKEDLKKAWDLLEGKVLDYTCNLLQSQAFIDHTKEINSVYALIPIISFVFNKPDNKLSESEIKKIVKWFYYSQIRHRYISQLQQKLDKDLSIIDRSESPFDELLAIIAEERPLEIKSSEFVGRGIRHPLFNLMRWYFKSIGAVCLGTGLSLRQNMGKRYSLEYDHIFAYANLRDSEYFDMNDRFDEALAHEFTNRAILTSTENRTKSAKETTVYLSEIKENFPNALKLQCIPENEELWKIENYILFLEKRRELISEKLNHFLSNISISKECLKLEVDLEEIIHRGENEYVEFKSTMRWDLREGRFNKKMEEIILKSISALSNFYGGKLFIGLDDDGNALGLEYDYNTLKEANKDVFELHLRDIINREFGKDYGTSIKVSFPIIKEKEICLIDVPKGISPLYLNVIDKKGQKHKRFYVRSGNSSQDLAIDETASYINSRF